MKESKPFHLFVSGMIDRIEVGTYHTQGAITQAAEMLAGVTIPAQHQLIFLAFGDKLIEIFAVDAIEYALILNEVCRAIKPYVASLEQPKAVGFRDILKNFVNTSDDSEIQRVVLEALDDRLADFGQHASRRRQDPLIGPACATAKVGGMRGIPSPTDRVPGPGLGFNRGHQPEVAGEGGI